MAWKDLAKDIADELGQVGLDSVSLYQDGLRWIRPEKDESRKNYDRWYAKQVWYPKNREKILAKQRDRYHNVVKKDPVKYERLLAKSRKYSYKEKCPEGYARRLARNKGYYHNKIMADPVKHAAHLAKRRADYAEKKANGKTSASSSRE